MRDSQYSMAGNDQLTDARLKYRTALAPFATVISNSCMVGCGAGFIEREIWQVAEGVGEERASGGSEHWSV